MNMQIYSLNSVLIKFLVLSQKHDAMITVKPNLLRNMGAEKELVPYVIR